MDLKPILVLWLNIAMWFNMFSVIYSISVRIGCCLFQIYGYLLILWFIYLCGVFWGCVFGFVVAVVFFSIGSWFANQE